MCALTRNANLPPDANLIVYHTSADSESALSRGRLIHSKWIKPTAVNAERRGNERNQSVVSFLPPFRGRILASKGGLLGREVRGGGGWKAGLREGK
ncbi:hypothetical protein KM043_005404 [Ampulex compressa]|nr:hypothetical protein KM043_005404 [Ampulex compressa]